MKRFLSIAAAAMVLSAITSFNSPARAATIGGSVSTADGRAIPGAIVTIQQVDVQRGQRAYAGRVQAGRNGAYVFDNLPGGQFVVATTTRAGADRERAAVRANGAARVQLVVGGRNDGRGGRD